jgi:putative nucleotidyltransferase with HDIG domain
MPGEHQRPRVEILPISRILSRRFAARAGAKEEEIRRLSVSIRNHGLLHPLLVRPVGREYEVVCGQRRFQACRALGMGHLFAVVRVLDDRQAVEISLAENVRRESLSSEERRSLLKRIDGFFPARRPGEVEAWLGPIETGDGAEPAPFRPDRVPSENVSVVTADGAGLRRSLPWRVRTLLDSFSKSGKLDTELLKNVLSELMDRLDRTPMHEFLDLSYRGRSKRYVSRHCLNVAKVALFLARTLGMDRQEIEDIGVCALLHDIGMMKVKQEVFTKHAALDQEEWEQVKGHPVEGALLLTKEVVLRDVVARVALEHHEKPDGTGYPQGKKKNEIHVYARIINVVDTYGAMVSPRAHRLPMLPYQAMRVVMDNGAKGMLDWEIVQSLVKAMSIYPIGSYVKLEGGEIAQVVRAQSELPEKPVIAVVADAQGNILRVPVEIDLAMTEPVPKFEPVASPT